MNVNNMFCFQETPAIARKRGRPRRSEVTKSRSENVASMNYIQSFENRGARSERGIAEIQSSSATCEMPTEPFRSAHEPSKPETILDSNTDAEALDPPQSFSVSIVPLPQTISFDSSCDTLEQSGAQPACGPGMSSFQDIYRPDPGVGAAEYAPLLQTPPSHVAGTDHGAAPSTGDVMALRRLAEARPGAGDPCRVHPPPWPPLACDDAGPPAAWPPDAPPPQQLGAAASGAAERLGPGPPPGDDDDPFHADWPHW